MKSFFTEIPLAHCILFAPRRTLNVSTFDPCSIDSFLEIEGGKQVMCTLVIHSLPLYLHLI